MLQTMKTRVLALGATAAIVGSALGGVAIAHAQTPPPSNPPSASQQATNETSQEANESAMEQVEKGEPALPGGGHADQGTNAQHDFQGIE